MTRMNRKPVMLSEESQIKKEKKPDSTYIRFSETERRSVAAKGGNRRALQMSKKQLMFFKTALLRYNLFTTEFNNFKSVIP